MRHIDRREFIRGGAACLAANQLACSFRPDRDTGVKLIVLGLDGMDPRRIARLMREGRMPTFRKVARDGYFGPTRSRLCGRFQTDSAYAQPRAPDPDSG